MPLKNLGLRSEEESQELREEGQEAMKLSKRLSTTKQVSTPPKGVRGSVLRCC